MNTQNRDLAVAEPKVPVPVEKEGDRQRWTTPAVDVYESDTGFRFLADLPGVEKDLLRVTLENGVLTIEGTTPEEDPTPGAWLWREHSPVNYRRRFKVGNDVRSEDAEAEFKNGTLELFLPFAPEAKPKEIAVKFN